MSVCVSKFWKIWASRMVFIQSMHSDFRSPEIEDRGGGGILFLSCLSFHNFVTVILSETLNLLITFEHWMLEHWYFTKYSLRQDLYVGTTYLNIFDPLILTLGFGLDFFLQNFNLANRFWTVSASALIFHMTVLFLLTRPFRGYQNFWPSELKRGVRPLFFKA